MKRFKFVLPVFVGTLVYGILSFSVGPRGLLPMKRLAEQKTLVTRNLESLYSIKEDLNARMQNLSADPDTISVYAHELGYVAEGERLVKLAGFSGGIDRNLAAGDTLAPVMPEHLGEWICKSLGLAAGLLVFFLYLHFVPGARPGRRKKNARHGTVPAAD